MFAGHNSMYITQETPFSQHSFVFIKKILLASPLEIVIAPNVTSFSSNDVSRKRGILFLMKLTACNAVCI